MINCTPNIAFFCTVLINLGVQIRRVTQRNFCMLGIKNNRNIETGTLSGTLSAFLLVKMKFIINVHVNIKYFHQVNSGSLADTGFRENNADG